MSSDPRTTVRVALVLNGGVSLAVWMSGVVRELDLICRASRGEDPPADAGPEERRHHEAWRRITDGKKITLAVDIIGGTSAGGLNGTILATALACGTPLPDLKDLWNRSASLTARQLLWNPGLEPVVSLLDGVFFEETVADVLHGIRAEHDESAPPPPEVTLFVTATALGRCDRAYRDVAGGEFQVADHRRLYRFRAACGYRCDEAGGFEEVEVNEFLTGIPALSRAARASASFPAAFAPVQETPELAARRYPPRADGGALAFLMDGGVLDNAPIEPVIAEVATRRVDGPIRRLLVYVVPSNGVVPRLPSSAVTDRPDWVRVVSAAMDLPRESDFRHDVDTLTDALGAARARQDAASELFRDAGRDEDARTALIASARGMRRRYRASRIDGTLREVRTAIATRQGLVPVLVAAPERPRAAGLGAWVPAPDGDLPGLDPWRCGVSGAMRTVRVLLRECRRQIEDAPGDDALHALAARLSTDLAKITALEEAVLEDVCRLGGNALSFANPDLDDAELTQIVDEVFRSRDVPQVLGALMTDAVQEYATHHGLDTARLAEVLVAVEIVTGAVADRPEDQGPPPFGFVRLGPDIDSKAFPETVGLGGNKLYGTRLAHFAAFGLPTWRDWDYTWGRIDAAAHVARLLHVAGEEAAELEEQVVGAEGWAPTEFRQQISRLGTDDREILDELRQSAAGRAALHGIADSLLRFLGQPHTLVTTAGEYVRAAAGHAAPPGIAGLRMRALRVAVTRHRRRLWRWIDSPPPRNEGRGRAGPSRR